MHFDFETAVNRKQIGNMKEIVLSQADAGPEPVMLSGAEMDFPTAPALTRSLADLVERGIFGYTIADGAYRETVRRWMRTARGFDVKPDEIVPTLGTIFALGTAIRAFTDPGDGVIIQHPSYYRYDVNVRNNGRAVVSNPLIERNGTYQIDFDGLEALMASPSNKLMVLCNPHNPTGRVFGRQDAERVARLSEAYGVVVFSDEIFAEVCFGGHGATPLAGLPYGLGITSTSLGKAFNLTGVNHANLIIRDEALRKAYLKQRTADHFGSLDPFFYAAVAGAYSDEGLRWIEAMRAHVYGLYERVDAGLRARAPMLRLSPLEGGFVLWLDCRALGLPDAALHAFFEREAGILADPGTDYGPGGSGFMRLNIATTTARADAFVDRLSRACARAGLCNTK